MTGLITTALTAIESTDIVEATTASPSITDWLMVIITVIYVIATIFICIFNGKSASAAKKQIVESQKQTVEAKELSILPYFKISFERNDDASPQLFLNLSKTDDEAIDDSHELRKTMVFTYENIGLGAAKNIYFDWSLADGSTKHCTVAHKMILCGPDNAVSYNMRIYTNSEQSIVSTATLTMMYEDLIGTKYKQEIMFTYSINRGIDDRTNIDFDVLDPQKI